ncbi:MAG: hypothetical protein JWM76_4562 [Pseudonocardiales bacterium]|nr:hypothetical protein [Pseudonocardiales bacterium]
MTPRIDPVTEPTDEQAALLARTLPGADGQPLNVFKTLAHRPEMLRRMNALGGYFFVHTTINARDRELVILRVAARTHSSYETAQHEVIAARCGLEPAEIAAALDRDPAYTWPPPDGALLQFVDELLATDSVSDSAWASVSDRFTEVERGELLLLVGYYRLLAGFLNGVQVEID